MCFFADFDCPGRVIFFFAAGAFGAAFLAALGFDAFFGFADAAGLAAGFAGVGLVFFFAFAWASFSASIGRSMVVRSSLTLSVYSRSLAGSSASSSAGVPTALIDLAKAGLSAASPEGLGVTMTESCSPFGVMRMLSGVCRATA